MSKLFETVQRIEAVIAQRDLPIFVTKGKIAIKTGFPLGLITARTPDDPVVLQKLRAAARDVLGEGIW
ncbi:MAG TPA: hypothetical protein VFG53_13610 [Anaeromyxobacter sp.]|nr:hypothetical protein [Anaeromyxobacter sp.]